MSGVAADPPDVVFAAAKHATHVAVAIGLVLLLTFAGLALGGGARRHDLVAPTPPTSLRMTSATETSIALAWAPATDNVQVAGYSVYTDTSRTWGARTNVTGTAYVLSGLTCSKSYSVAVDAYDAAGNRSGRATLTASTTLCATPTAVSPPAPTGLTVANVTQTSLDLHWNASSDSLGVTGYDVFRDGVKTATVTSTSSSQTGLSCGASSSFGVVAVDAGGNRSPQATVVATTSACVQAPPPAPSPPPSTASRGQPGLGLMALGDTLSAYRAHLSSYSYIVLSAGDEGLVQGIPGIALTYTSPAIPNDQFDVPGLTYAQANANGWLLKDASGNYVHPYHSTHQWVTDVGSPAVQQAFVSSVLTYLSSHPTIKGIEIDNLLPDVAYFNVSKTWPAKYPTAQAWQDAQVAFLTAVGPALRSRGYYVMINATGYTTQSGFDGGTFDQAWFARLAKTGGCDAIFAEQWLQNPNNDTQLMDDSNPGSFMTSWSGWERLMATAQSNGVDLFAITQGPDPAADPTTAHHLMRYARASFLLDWNGHGGMFSYTVSPQYTSRVEAWDPLWTQDLGAPLGPKTEAAPDVWRRDFSGGFILVNPTRSTVTVSVGGTPYAIPATDAVIHFGA